MLLTLAIQHLRGFGTLDRRRIDAYDSEIFQRSFPTSLSCETRTHVDRD